MNRLLYSVVIFMALVFLYQYFSEPENKPNCKENFLVLRNGPYYSNCLRNVFGNKVCYPYGYRPWSYGPYRHTRLMSHDLRGDPYYIARRPYYWGNSDFLPYWV
jgi:hypothetical protein